MKLKFLTLQIDSDDYLIPNPENSTFPFRVSNIVSDFSFQTEFILNFFSRKLSLIKYQSDRFQFICIKGRKTPQKNIFISDTLKALEIEISFDESRYFKLYPFTNEYPLINKLLNPVPKEDDFNDFLFEMIKEGLDKSKKQNAQIPHEYLEEILLDFKLNRYKNEWIEKTKIFKEYQIKASFLCKINCNFFTLTLLIHKNNQELFKEEILKTLPSSLIYRWQFKDILIRDGKLIIIKGDSDRTILFEKKLEEIL